MSLVIEKSLTPNKHSIEMYGIRTKFDSQGNVYLILPICLSEREEAKKFYNDLCNLGNKMGLKELEDGRIRVAVTNGDKGFFSKNKRTAYVTFAGDGKSVLELGTYSENGSSLLDSEALIDDILRKTILGQRLKEYWTQKEKISEWDASGRLFKMTPKAGTLSASTT